MGCSELDGEPYTHGHISPGNTLRIRVDYYANRLSLIANGVGPNQKIPGEFEYQMPRSWGLPSSPIWLMDGESKPIFHRYSLRKPR